MMIEKLRAFGAKLEELRTAAGLSRPELVERLAEIYARSEPGALSIDEALLYKWERAYAHQGRVWRPSRQQVLYLVETFADWLDREKAWTWAALAGIKMSQVELQQLFPPGHDLPPRQAPPLPEYYVNRQLEAVLAVQLREPEPAVLVLWGPGGAGKTTLAACLAHALTSDFPDGVIWFPGQPHVTATSIQGWIADSLHVPLDEDSPAQRAARLQSRLQKRRCLLIIDNLWGDLPDLKHLRLGGPTSKLLVTTRDAKVATILEAFPVPVTGLQVTEGLNLLTRWVGHPIEAVELVTRLGGLPLALKLSGAQLHAGIPLEELLNYFRRQQVDLSQLDLDEPRDRQESLTLCFDLSYQRLESTLKERFAGLGYFVGRRFEEIMLRQIWGIDHGESRRTLDRLHRFALLERAGQTFELHPLLHDYARQKLAHLSATGTVLPRRHAIWHIRHVLYHPHLLDPDATQLPALDERWADVLLAVRWAADHEPYLAAQAAVLAYSERPALLEGVGPALIEAVAACRRDIADPVEGAVLGEVLGDLHSLAGEIDAGLAVFEEAGALWAGVGEGLSASRAWLRLAGAHLLRQNQAAAAEAAREAQRLLEGLLPLSEAALPQARRLFYWFDMVYNSLVRWPGLPEEDVARLADLADTANEPILAARGLHIYQLWCTTPHVARSPETRRQGCRLALAAYQMWRRAGRQDRADDEICFAKYRLTGYYSRLMARRFARRRSHTSPQVEAGQHATLTSAAMRWWLSATERQRIQWLSWMLPRYLGAVNRPCHPRQKNPLPTLSPQSQAYRWVDDILNVGMLGSSGRWLPQHLDPPANHFLNGPEWRILSGQRAFPFVEPDARTLIERYLAALEIALKE